MYVDASAQTEYCDSSLRDQATQQQYDDDDLTVRMSTPVDDGPLPPFSPALSCVTNQLGSEDNTLGSDPDYCPPSSGTSSESGSEIEEGYYFLTEKKFIVFSSCLDELLLRCQKCDAAIIHR